ncbi:MAG TPA: hypothetical protein VIN08_25525 [Ohtaekwangia sp.]|uniref:hypothetical protein n=1 Tax=Ohtaekwangia sp. TaxID=2066019 RepID=UPI002F93126C
MERKNIRTCRLVNFWSLFRISLVVIILTILGVYFWGLGAHHTFFENSMWSTTILSIAFWWFTSAGLYKGIKLKASAADLTLSPGKIQFPDVGMNLSDVSFDFIDIDIDDGEGGILAIILSIILWILVAIFLAGLLWFFGHVLIFIVATFMAMLYWIFFRALRLVFRYSHKTKGDLAISILTAAGYTVLYNFWIYGIFIAIGYMKHWQ